MDSKRRQTLEALDKFLQIQRTMLEQSRRDIERLARLKETDAIHGNTVRYEEIHDSEHESLIDLQADYPHLSNYTSLCNGLPDDIEWTVFASHDLTPLKSLCSAYRQTLCKSKEPSKTQLSPLSCLQAFVKTSRQSIVDPILAEYALHSEPEDSEEEQALGPEEIQRQQERQKIRDLKMRKIRACGLTIRSHAQDMDGVYIRRDIEDESAEVDISIEEGALPPPPRQPSTSSNSIMVDERSTPLPQPTPKTPITKAPVKSSSHMNHSKIDLSTRKRPSHATDGNIAHPATSGEKKRPLSPASSTTNLPTSKCPRDNGKAKSATYKLAWSDSEQNLLERLLEEIPAGEKNRWAKISRAMNGRRTPKQVASRVQKYFEKLKRFGVGVDSTAG